LTGFNSRLNLCRFNPHQEGFAEKQTFHLSPSNLHHPVNCPLLQFSMANLEVGAVFTFFSAPFIDEAVADLRLAFA